MVDGADICGYDAIPNNHTFHETIPSSAHHLPMKIYVLRDLTFQIFRVMRFLEPTKATQINSERQRPSDNEPTGVGEREAGDNASASESAVCQAWDR